LTSNTITARVDEMEDGNRTRLICDKLEESLVVAADPSAPRFTHDEIFTPLRKKYGYDV